jgi:hypothetical protein
MAKYDKPLLDMEGVYHSDDGTNWVEQGTIFVENDLGISGRPPMSAIYFPPRFYPGQTINVLLYLHGHGNSYNIQDYLRQFKLREIIKDSGKNLVFIAPTLGKSSEAGRLMAPGGIDRYLREMMQSLFDYGPYPGTGIAPRVGKIVLAAHSGGGVPMAKIADNLSQSGGKNDECWGFDCLYDDGDPLGAPDPLTVKEKAHSVAPSEDAWERQVCNSVEGFWMNWSQGGNRSFRAFWGGGGTLTRTANLQLYSMMNNADGVTVEPSFYDNYGEITKVKVMPHPVSGHDFVPKTVLGKCLDDSTTF